MSTSFLLAWICMGHKLSHNLHPWLSTHLNTSHSYDMCERTCTVRYSMHYPIRTPESKVHGANMGPIWGRQGGRGGPHVGPMNFVIWDVGGSNKNICVLTLCVFNLNPTVCLMKTWKILNRYQCLFVTNTIISPLIKGSSLSRHSQQARKISNNLTTVVSPSRHSLNVWGCTYATWDYK